MIDKLHALHDAQWTCTDPDSAQYLRPLDVQPGLWRYFEWECIQVFGNDDTGYMIAHEIVRFSDISNDEKESCVKAFYSGGLADLEDLPDYLKDRTVAECIFETEYGMTTGLSGDTIYQTYEAAENAVKDYVAKKNTKREV